MSLGTVFDNFVAYCDHVGRSHVPHCYLGNRWMELTIVAAAFMVVMVVFIRYVGFCSQLQAIYRNAVAAIYEMLLYHRSAFVVATAECKLAWNSLKFLLLLSPSLILGGIVFVGMFNTASNRYSYGPIAVGQDVVVRTEPVDGAVGKLADCKIVTDESDLEITAKVRSASRQIIWTRLKPKRAGMLNFKTGPNGSSQVLLNVESFNRPAPAWQYIDGIKVNINYPHLKWRGLRHGWLMYFLLMCAVTGIPLMRWLKVSV